MVTEAELLSRTTSGGVWLRSRVLHRGATEKGGEGRDNGIEVEVG